MLWSIPLSPQLCYISKERNHSRWEYNIKIKIKWKDFFHLLNEENPPTMESITIIYFIEVQSEKTLVEYYHLGKQGNKLTFRNHVIMAFGSYICEQLPLGWLIYPFQYRCRQIHRIPSSWPSSPISKCLTI
jgi:hypothetical protein